MENLQEQKQNTQGLKSIPTINTFWSVNGSKNEQKVNQNTVKKNRQIQAERFLENWIHEVNTYGFPTEKKTADIGS